MKGSINIFLFVTLSFSSELKVSYNNHKTFPKEDGGEVGVSGAQFSLCPAGTPS